jgi:hypothetical protein
MKLIERLKAVASSIFTRRETAFDRLEGEIEEKQRRKWAIADAKNALIKDHGKVCRICKHSQAVKTTPAHELIECRFHPPVYERPDRFGMNRGSFPMVEVTDWCGNWKVRDPRPYELPEQYR